MQGGRQSVDIADLPPVPCFWNILNACREHRNEPATLMSKTDRKVSGGISPSSVLLGIIPAFYGLINIRVSPGWNGDSMEFTLNKRSSRPVRSMITEAHR